MKHGNMMDYTRITDELIISFFSQKPKTTCFKIVSSANSARLSSISQSSSPYGSIMTESALARERATLSCAIVPSGSEMQSANSCATCKTHHWCHNTADIQVALVLHKSVRGKQIEDRQEMVITILYAEMSKAVQNRQESRKEVDNFDPLQL